MSDYEVNVSGGRWRVFHHGQAIWEGDSEERARYYIAFLKSGSKIQPPQKPEDEYTTKWIK